MNRIFWWVIAILAVVDLAAIIAGFFVHVEEYEGRLCYYASVFPPPYFPAITLLWRMGLSISPSPRRIIQRFLLQKLQFQATGAWLLKPSMGRC